MSPKELFWVHSQVGGGRIDWPRTNRRVALSLGAGAKLGGTITTLKSGREGRTLALTHDRQGSAQT
jgi:hypothetical protein